MRTKYYIVSRLDRISILTKDKTPLRGLVVIGEEIEEIKVARLVSKTLYKLKFYKFSFNVQLLGDFGRRHYANN